MQVLSKEEETKRCQDTVTRLILALSALAAHDRSGRSALEAELEEAKSKLLSLGRMVTTVTGSGFGFYDISGPDVLQHVLDPRTRVESVLGGESKALRANFARLSEFSEVPGTEEGGVPFSGSPGAYAHSNCNSP